MIEREKIDTDKNRLKLMTIMSEHIGEHKAIGMAELYEAVFDRPWNNRINDTRALRTLIDCIRWDGTIIAATSKRNGGGYYLSMIGSEAAAFIERREKRIKRMLKQNSRMLKANLPNYLGQLQIKWRDED